MPHAVPRSAPILAALLAIVLSGCERADPPPAPVVTASTPTAQAQPALGGFGFDVGGMDRSVAPGDDFFAYANGGWVKNTEIPADRSSYNSFSVLAEQAQADTRAILEEAAADASRERRRASRSATTTPRSWTRPASRPRASRRSSPSSTRSPRIADKAALARALGEHAARRRRPAQRHQLLHRPPVRPVGVAGPGAARPQRALPGAGRPRHARPRLLPRRRPHGRAAHAVPGARRHRCWRWPASPTPTAKAARILALETAIAAGARHPGRHQRRREGRQRLDAGRLRRARRRAWTGPRSSPAPAWASSRDFIVWQPKAVAGISRAGRQRSRSTTWKDYLRLPRARPRRRRTCRRPSPTSASPSTAPR